jgi:hypothetical protein
MTKKKQAIFREKVAGARQVLGGCDRIGVAFVTDWAGAGCLWRQASVANRAYRAAPRFPPSEVYDLPASLQSRKCVLRLGEIGFDP